MADFKVVVECRIPGQDEIHVLKVSADTRDDAALQAVYKAREHWPEAQSVSFRRMIKMPEVQHHGG